MFVSRKRYQEMAVSYLEARAQAAGWKREYEAASAEVESLRQRITEMPLMAPEQKADTEGAYRRGQQMALRSVRHFLVGDFEKYLADSPLYSYESADVEARSCEAGQRVLVR